MKKNNQEQTQSNMQPNPTQKSSLYLVRKGCPLCKGDLKGNDVMKYYCQKCNVLFGRKEIRSYEERTRDLEEEKKEKESETEKLEKERKETEKIQRERIEKELFEERELKRKKTEEQQEKEHEEKERDAKKESTGNEEQEESISKSVSKNSSVNMSDDNFSLESSDKIIGSSASKKIHSGNCHFVAKIQRDKRIYFTTIEDGEKEGYDMCVCLRRRKMLDRQK